MTTAQAAPAAGAPDRRGRVEIVAVVLLAVAAVATAWGPDQPGTGRRPRPRVASTPCGIDAAHAQGLAEGQTQVDIATFIQWVNATAIDDDRARRLLLARFRPEFRPAFDAWQATDPLTNPDTPPTPFAMDEYQLEARTEAERLDAEAEEMAATVRRNIQRSANYVPAVVLFAVALFFAGMSPNCCPGRRKVSSPSAASSSSALGVDRNVPDQPLRVAERVSGASR